MFLTESAAAPIGLLNSIGNLVEFARGYIVGYLTNKTENFYAGVIYISCSVVVAAILILLVKHSPKQSDEI